FNAVDGTTFTMRSKEEAHDYRYFPEPDLQPVTVTENYIHDVRKTLPTLPNDLYKLYTKQYGLSEYDANLIIESKPLAIYYNELISFTKNFKAAANWLNGAIKSYLNENGITIENFNVSPDKIAALIQLIDEGKVSNTIANQKIFPAIVAQPELSPSKIAEDNNLIQESNDDELIQYIEQVIHNNPSEIERFKNGEKQLLGFLMGQLMKLSQGKADPKKANILLREKLN